MHDTKISNRYELTLSVQYIYCIHSVGICTDFITIKRGRTSFTEYSTDRLFKSYDIIKPLDN
jgi:hypothetical protein